MRDLPLRAQRALKEGVVIRKRRGNHAVSPPLVCSAAAQAAFQPAMRGHMRCSFRRAPPLGAQCAPLQAIDKAAGAPRSSRPTEPVAPDYPSAPKYNPYLYDKNPLSDKAHPKEYPENHARIRCILSVQRRVFQPAVFDSVLHLRVNHAIWINT